MFKNNDLLKLSGEVHHFFKNHPMTKHAYDMIKPYIHVLPASKMKICVKNSINVHEDDKEADSKIPDASVGIVIARLVTPNKETQSSNCVVVAFVEKEIFAILGEKHIIYTGDTYDATEPD